MIDEIDMEIDEPDVSDAPARTSVPSVPRKKDAPPRINAGLTDEVRERLAQKYAGERERRQKAEAERDKAVREAEEANYISIRASEESVKTKIEDLRQKLIAARNLGDIEAEFRLNDEIVDQRVALRELTRGREHLETTREAEPAKLKREPEPVDPDTLSDDDRLEHELSRYSPRTGRWLREHPEFVTNEKAKLRAHSAHLAAIADDVVPDTDEYFDYVEKRLGIRNEPEDEDVAEGDDPDEGTIIDTPAPKPAPRQNVAAPADERRTPSKKFGDMGNGNFRLPAAAVAYCRKKGLDPASFSRDIRGITERQLIFSINSDIDPREYLKNAKLLKRDGKLS